MRILALDLGTKTGYAMIHDSGVWRFPLPEHAPRGSRYLRFERTIRPHVRDAGLVVYEKVMGHGKDGATAAHVYGAFEGFLEASCAVDGTRLESVGVATLKKYATGSGRAKKDQMIAAARRRWPDVEIVDDNHADALWLLEYAQEHFGGGAKNTPTDQPTPEFAGGRRS